MKNKANNSIRILLLVLLLLLAVTAAYILYVVNSSTEGRRFGPEDGDIALVVTNPEGNTW